MSHHLSPFRFGAMAAWLVLGSVACNGQADFSSVQPLSVGDGTAWWESDNDIGLPASGKDPQHAGPSPETCDGLDNDLNGQVDENQGGEPCTGASGTAGTWTCVAGKLVCAECIPGESKKRGCGCSEDTADACNDSGRWVSGVCNACADLDEGGCGVDAACKPGDERIMRCDTCSGGGSAGCGANCMGALHRCSSNCEWVRIGTCQTYDPQCDGDYQRVRACGRCGRTTERCDGCFYIEDACHDQGACLPGESYAVPCFDNACAYGFTATARCNAQCSWDLGTCEGCTPGTVDDVTTLCVNGHAECGQRVDRVHCVGQTDVVSCDEKTLTEGIEHHTNISNECGGVVAPGFCSPGAVTVEHVSCGPNSCGYELTYTHTCFGNGCGESVSVSGACPECQPGEVQTTGCSPGPDLCGTQSRSCTSGCGWGGWGACDAYECPPAPPPPPPGDPNPPPDNPPEPPPDDPGDPPDDHPPPPPPPPHG